MHGSRLTYPVLDAVRQRDGVGGNSTLGYAGQVEVFGGDLVVLDILQSFLQHLLVLGHC